MLCVRERERKERMTYLIVVLPADRIGWFRTQFDDARQIDGTAHSHKHFAPTENSRTRFYFILTKEKPRK